MIAAIAAGAESARRNFGNQAESEQTTMTTEQIQWASSHDWFIAEACEDHRRGVWCEDRDSAGGCRLVFISNFRALRAFAGY